jgi:hypothetical protein
VSLTSKLLPALEAISKKRAAHLRRCFLKLKLTDDSIPVRKIDTFRMSVEFEMHLKPLKNRLPAPFDAGIRLNAL